MSKLFSTIKVLALMLLVMNISYADEVGEKKENSTAQEAPSEFEVKRQVRQEKNRKARNETATGDIIPNFNPDPNIIKQPEKRKKWDHVLPFYAQNVIDLNFDLPLPFSISLIPNYVKQKVSLADLNVHFNDANVGDFLDLGLVDFGNPEIKSQSLQLRFAAWIFPFLEMSTYVGRYHAKSDLLVEIPTAIFDKICSSSIDPTPARPNNGDDFSPSCDKSLYIDKFSPDLKGTNWGINLNLVTGFYDYFVLLPISYTWSRTDDGRTTTDSLLLTPRIGKSFKVKNFGLLSPYIGLSYMDTTSVSKDTIEVNSGPLETVSYSIKQENSDKYAALLGVNWNITRHYALTLEGTYGKGRESFIGMLSYRF